MAHGKQASGVERAFDRNDFFLLFSAKDTYVHIRLRAELDLSFPISDCCILAVITFIAFTIAGYHLAAILLSPVVLLGCMPSLKSADVMPVY